MKENYFDGYYHIAKDLEDYPDANVFVVYSRRGPGKTYGALLHSFINHIPMIYMKRTIEDVNLICSCNEFGFDPSPYVPLNRDLGTNIKGIKIKDGIGGFWECDDELHPQGMPVSYILALSAIKRFKGFDFSHCDWLVFDEFIPQVTERYNRGEGEATLDLYMTINRDREKRGKQPLKLILFANAEEISTPITNTLEIIDDMADLNASGESHKYLEDRGILIHHITEEEIPIGEAEKNGIFKAMAGTSWAAKSFGGEFANNDFSNIYRLPMKNFKCLIHVKYKTHDYYIYQRPTDGMYYMTTSKNKPIWDFNLNLENDQKRFWTEQAFYLRYECTNGKMKFEKYSMYDLIVNYKKFFKIL